MILRYIYIYIKSKYTNKLEIILKNQNSPEKSFDSNADSDF